MLSFTHSTAGTIKRLNDDSVKDLKVPFCFIFIFTLAETLLPLVVTQYFTSHKLRIVLDADSIMAWRKKRSLKKNIADYIILVLNNSKFMSFPIFVCTFNKSIESTRQANTNNSSCLLLLLLPLPLLLMLRKGKRTPST